MKSLIVIILIILIIIGTIALLFYENIKEAFRRIGDDISALYNLISSLQSKITQIEFNINSLNSMMENQKSEIDKIKEDISSLRNEINRRIILNPSYEELLNFIQEDDTDKLPYIEENYKFVCVDFADTFVKRFREKGFYSCKTTLYFEKVAHSIVAVNTSDYGIVYVEPQEDKVIFDLKVGDNYCQKVGLNCYERIIKISDCFNH